MRECKAHIWVAPDAWGPTYKQVVTERCRKCGARREVRNHMVFKVNQNVARVPPELKAQAAEDLMVRMR